jgi:hypothetical protein
LGEGTEVKISRSAVLLAGVASVSLCAHASELVSISFPDTVVLSQSTTQVGPRTVTSPFDYSGIGNIINPSVASPGSGSNANDFVLHQTINTVDITDVIVTFEFDASIEVSAFDLVQHHNGARTMELLAGDDLSAMTSAGLASVDENTIEYAVNRFEFGSTVSGKFVQVRLIEPELPGQGGWAFYRLYLDVIPAPSGAFVFALATAAVTRRRR